MCIRYSVILIAQHASVWLTIPGLVIVGREIVISALREWMAEMNRSMTVAVSYIGKVKTTIQMIAIALLLAIPPQSESWVLGVSYSLLYIAATMTLWSMTIYLRSAWPDLRSGLKK